MWSVGCNSLEKQHIYYLSCATCEKNETYKPCYACCMENDYANESITLLQSLCIVWKMTYASESITLKQLLCIVWKMTHIHQSIILKQLLYIVWKINLLYLENDMTNNHFKTIVVYGLENDINQSIPLKKLSGQNRPRDEY